MVKILQRTRYDGHTVEIFCGVPGEREAFEHELSANGLEIPLPHRIAWARAQGPKVESWFVAVRDAAGKAVAGFTVDVGRSRALPGHRILRVERFAAALTGEARTAGVVGLVEYVRRQRRIVRVHVEVFSRDAHTRAQVTDVLTRLGFQQSSQSRSYTKTLLIDLRPAEVEIFASLHPTARRHIRAVDKRPVQVRLITDTVYGERMAALLKDTMARTGGQSWFTDWPALIELSTRHPELSRIVGLFKQSDRAPEALLAFAWGRFHGNHADYAAAASTRATDLRIPLGYALAWDLMRWAKHQGGTWFDFGGVTPGHFGGEDPMGGISDFKRYFGGQVISIAEEWVLEPYPLKAKIAKMVSAINAWARKLLASRS